MTASAEDIVIKPKEIVLIPTGLKVKFPSDEVMLVFPRSSLAIKRTNDVKQGWSSR